MRPTDPLTAALVALEPIKTWSLIVTLFGDTEAEALSGKAVRASLDPLGLKPEAIRVALHRLKKDGWITSRKSGREVTYGLSPAAQAETDAVQADVYRAAVKYPEGWRAIAVEDTAELSTGAAPIIRLGRQLAVLPCSAPAPSVPWVEVTLATAAPPAWLAQRMVGAETPAIAAALAALATEAAERYGPDLTALPQHIRLLLLHRWRKMALRPACWAHIALFPNGAVAACHQKITYLLAQSPRPAPKVDAA